MAGALIGETFLSACIQKICQKIGSGEFLDLSGEKKLDRSLMEKLKLTLLTLHSVLNDAEEKHIVNPAVGLWLDKLKHAVFDAEDLLDEIDAEVLRSKVEASTPTSLNPFYQGKNGRVQVIFERLELLAKQKDLLGLIEENSAEWIFLVTSLFMEILSAACDQVSSPRRPGYALFGILLAIAALLTCIWELIYKGRKNNVAWRKRGCYMLFGSVIELFGLVGGIAQCVCSIIQYVYYIRRADNPIKLSILPAVFLICLIATRLSRKRMQTTDETGEHTA